MVRYIIYWYLAYGCPRHHGVDDRGHDRARRRREARERPEEQEEVLARPSRGRLRHVAADEHARLGLRRHPGHLRQPREEQAGGAQHLKGDCR